MAALTWRDVQAPNLSGAGDLLNSANSSFGNAMEMLRVNAERSAAQRKAAYSAGMMQQLAGLSDPSKIGEFAKQFNAEDLTPEAISVMMSQPGVLLDRQHKSLQIDSAQDSLDFTRNDRLGQQQAADVAIRAQELVSQGKTGEAHALLAREAAANPYARTHLDDDPSKLNSAAQVMQEIRGKEYDNNRKVNADTAKDGARDFFNGRLLREANSVEEARIIARREIQDPMVLAEVESLVGGSDDAAYQLRDANIPGLLDAEPALKTEYEFNQLEGDWLKADTGNLAGASPLAKMQKHLTAMNAAQGDPDKGPQNIADYVDSVGVSAGGISGFTGWEGTNENISEVIEKLGKEGIKIENRAEVAAALIATADTSNVAFSDSLAMNQEKAIELLRTSRKPGELSKAMTELAEYATPGKKFDELDANIQDKLDKAHIARSKGQTSQADKLDQAVRELVAEQRKIAEDYRAKRVGEEGEVAPPPADPTAIPGTAAAGPANASPATTLRNALARNPRINPNVAPVGPPPVPLTPEQIAERRAAALIAQEQMQRELRQSARMIPVAQ